MMADTGRPTLFSQHLANEVCEAIAGSRDGLEKICESNPHFPTARTIYNWMYKDDEFFQKYMQARAFQAHVLMDGIIDTANNDSEDTLIKINRARVKIDAYKIASARFNPKHFGDKQVIDNNHKFHEDDLKALK